MVESTTDTAPGSARAGASPVEEALLRAQELVDEARTGRGSPVRYVEAMQVGDLSLIALLLARPRPSEHEALASLEARRQIALDDWLRAEGVADRDPGRVKELMDRLGHDGLERTLRRYEEQRGHRTENACL